MLYVNLVPGERTVTFDPQGGTVSQNTVTVVPGNTYGTLPNPSMSGYTFDGWYTSKIDGVKISPYKYINSLSNDNCNKALLKIYPKMI